MIKNNFYGFIACMLLLSMRAFGQDAEVKVPDLNDKYSGYVKQLESGHTEIDYTDFRNSFLESKQYNLKGTDYNDLKKEVFKEIRNKNYKQVVKLTKEMLSMDYTSMFAHKYLQQTYKVLGDSLNQKKYHDIEFGLLYSITRSGDGKSCETGWHVTQIEEEYFILNMVGADLEKQSITRGGSNNCDKMQVKTEDGESKTYYFEINEVLEMESRLFGK